MYINKYLQVIHIICSIYMVNSITYFCYFLQIDGIKFVLYKYSLKGYKFSCLCDAGSFSEEVFNTRGNILEKVEVSVSLTYRT